MDSLRIVLIIIASLVIIALLIHGFWINKKERSSLFGTVNKSKKNNKNDSTLSWQGQPAPDNGFLDGVSEVRVVSSNKTGEGNATNLTDGFESSAEIDPESTLGIKKSPIQQDLFAQVEEPLDKEILASDNGIEDSHVEKSVASSAPASDDTAVSQQTDVLILHVSGLNGGQLRGDLLLNSIIQSGFQFGEMHIFHRHLDPAGNGPVLFSLANMLKPGTLDIENMPDAMLSGISMFMMIPSYGNGQQNFKLMLQTAQRIADDVNGMVLDDEHHMITPQKIDSYKRRIKQVSTE